MDEWLSVEIADVEPDRAEWGHRVFPRRIVVVGMMTRDLEGVDALRRWCVRVKVSGFSPSSVQYMLAPASSYLQPLTVELLPSPSYMRGARLSAITQTLTSWPWGCQAFVPTCLNIFESPDAVTADVVVRLAQ